MSIKLLNQKLRDTLGVSESGDAMFAWFHASNLTVRVLERGGYSDMPQLDNGEDAMKPANKWVIARWMPPSHTREQYRAAFGDSMPYPRNGRYTVTNIAMPEGVEPTERITDQAIAVEKIRRHFTEMQQMRAFEEGRNRAAAEKRRISADIMDDAKLPFNHVPGAKDHVSIGGI